MSIEFQDLPYPIDALEPHVSAKTMEFHYGKHHKSYVDKLNAAIQGTAYEYQPLEDIIAGAREAGLPDDVVEPAFAQNEEVLAGVALDALGDAEEASELLLAEAVVVADLLLLLERAARRFSGSPRTARASSPRTAS